MSELRARMLRDMTVRGFSPRTHEAYIRQVVGATCRTAALGGHRAVCPACGAEQIRYNSCRNRHCPKCQRVATERWLAARRREVLPIPYFHVVFTLPQVTGGALAADGAQWVPARPGFLAAAPRPRLGREAGACK